MDTFIQRLIALALPAAEATRLATELQADLQHYSPAYCWQKVSKTLFSDKTYPFSIQQLFYQTIYTDWNRSPGPAWLPDEQTMATANLTRLMQTNGLADYAACYAWSIQHYAVFWQTMTDLCAIRFAQPYTSLVDLSAGAELPMWFPGAKLNIVESCFQADVAAVAIISQTEEGELVTTRYGELQQLVKQIAAAISQRFAPGDPLAIVMPMTKEAVAIYLAVIYAGCVVVAVPDSFAADEIAARFDIAKVKAVFCQDVVVRDKKILPLYEKITAIASAPPMIVINQSAIALRAGDSYWRDFVTSALLKDAIIRDPQDAITILFSSGTTGMPKAIPWTHTTPIKCASDAYLHHNLQPNDIFCWPSNLGWMMGPWLIFACLLNRATIALSAGAPTGAAFGQFVQDARVSILGVVPTLVRSWRASACMESYDWRAIKLFTSTGERSSAMDMLYLMSLANYQPIIEYCGGTEIGGAYLTGTVLQPAAPAAFTTPTLGTQLVLLDENKNVTTTQGEAALVPPVMGLSTMLLNSNHHQVYYADMPSWQGQLLRRHGDEVEHCANGFYRLQGRVDDTMKLSGIKISSAELEAVLNLLSFVYETAAVAVPPVEGGPNRLVIFVVLKADYSVSLIELKSVMQAAIKQQLNPLFKIDEVCVLAALPRTASNKVMRKLLREGYLHSEK
ncbi:MAG TPA: AMP-binding protein [Gammaproteobacteria bacterium]|jgi:acetyl-CoA synthetase|nr:AMP-binding protein [Gammaproteobacteria bacterium]